MTVTADRLRERLDYDPSTGIFRHRTSIGGVNVGSIAGSVKRTGYRYIVIDRQTYAAHHLAWLHVHGEWADELDHRNRVCDYNAIDNLRPATRSQNLGNRSATKRNRTGFKGVTFSANGWTATIGFNHKCIYLGRFKTAEAAHKAYVAAAERLFGEFARAA